MPLSVENLCGLLIRSRLQPVEKVKECYEKWQKQAADKKSTRDFARWLVENGLVTEYQATLLSNGYADNFFLGEYKILDRIGKGRLAGVYKAVHASGQVVAIKVLPPSKAANPNLLKRFEREAQVAEQLDHPNVVRTFHHGQSNGLHYIVMEYLEGETLKNVLRTRHRLPLVEALRIAYYLGQGLQYLHEKGLVHRDLCPENIMLCPAPTGEETTRKCSVKILDIGLSRTLFETKRKTTFENLTATGEIIGNPEYMAPEQARDPNKADIRSDLYSLGCVLYHMLAGRPPFSDVNPMRLAVLHATESPPPLKDVGIESSGELNHLLGKLLAKDPAQRFETPTMLCEAVRQLLGAEVEAMRSRPESREMAGYLESLRRGQPSQSASATATPGTSQFP
ncbi:MAG: serine/threonine protein kinase, partial [Gemmatales bacterium]|nr:serine/threonine protein kinase [Gemmatales bacterium]MDW8385942.1 serine/threonine-protein kinase [Gemmatales bacterium]